MGGYISEKSNTSLLGSNRLGRGFIVHTIVFLDTVGSMVDFDDIKTNNQQYKKQKDTYNQQYNTYKQRYFDDFDDIQKHL